MGIPRSFTSREESPLGFKRWLRPLVDRSTRLLGILARRERELAKGLTVLTYHRILPPEQSRGYPLPSLAMPAGAFRDQVAFLASRFQLLTVGRALEAWSQAPPDPPVISLTFDDGYRDNYEIAAPILEEHGARGTFFVTTEVTQRGGTYWFDRAIEIWRQGRLPAGDEDAAAFRRHSLQPPLPFAGVESWIEYLKGVEAARRDELLDALGGAALHSDAADPDYRVMSVEQLRDLAGRGHEIGSHSARHGILPLASDDELRHELADSRRQLGSWLGEEVRGFCYPNGDHDDRVVQQTAAAGYVYACTTRPGINSPPFSPHRLYRRDMTPSRVTDSRGDHSEQSFRQEIAGVRDAFR